MGKFTIKILDSVLEKIKSFKEGAFGTLLTTTESDEKGFVVLGFVLTSTGGEDNVVIDSDLAELHFPKGAYLGSFHITSKDYVNSSNDVLVLYVHPETSKVTVFYENERDYPIEVVSQAELAAELFIVRARLVLPVSCQATVEGIDSMIENLRQKLDEVAIAELEGIPLDKPFKTLGAKNQFSSIKNIEVVEMTPLIVMSPNEDTEVKKGILIDYKRDAEKSCSFDLALDALALIPRHEPASFIAEFVGVNLRGLLSLHQNCLVSQLKEMDSFSVPETFHFLPDTLAHFVTVVYPKKKLDRDLSDYRTFLHQAFALPMDRPLLMRGNAFTFHQEEEAGTELVCPHESVGPSQVVGGDPALVQGKYKYYHYCQQGMDDDGWGCAYRSLQTLASWFKLQGYTTRTVPTLKEIQQCLVSIGDKPSNFVGSSQWIGSTEVSFCLDTLLGVTSRIVSVSSGEEMSMKGGELSHHFKTQGTPVMIGGGNLAHTILGVDYNRKTGDIKFLILDPHYTGGENLNTIVAKGWCGWKGLNFWKKGCFYNMCMPCRPKCI